MLSVNLPFLSSTPSFVVFFLVHWKCICTKSICSESARNPALLASCAVEFVHSLRNKRRHCSVLTMFLGQIKSKERTTLRLGRERHGQFQKAYRLTRYICICVCICILFRSARVFVSVSMYIKCQIITMITHISNEKKNSTLKDRRTTLDWLKTYEIESMLTMNDTKRRAQKKKEKKTNI